MPEPAVEVADSVLAGLHDAGRGGRELPRVFPGRYPIRAWAFVLGQTASARPPERRQWRRRSRPSVGRRAASSASLEALALLFSRIAPYAVWYTGPVDLVDQLHPLLAA